MFPGLAAALPHIRSGRIKPLAITGNSRQPTVKDVPTMIESGFKGFDAVQWYGVVGPAGLPPAVVKQLNATLNATLAAPDMKEKLSTEAVEPTPMRPEQFGEYIQAEVARWTALAKERKIQVEE
jgi:tripartite-type tricarboxylate transporter receptor subunit TctC